ncbi:MAG: hypothetical protein V9E89_14280 [Ilumatobacteraceae bacterium]
MVSVRITLADSIHPKATRNTISNQMPLPGLTFFNTMAVTMKLGSTRSRSTNHMLMRSVQPR